MTYREWIELQFRQACGNDDLGDVLLEEAMRLVDVRAEKADVELSPAAIQQIAEKYGPRFRHLCDLLRMIRRKAQTGDGDPVHRARALMRREMGPAALEKAQAE